MLVRFAYLAVTHAFAALRLLPMTDREKDVEMLALRHQLAVLQFLRRPAGSSSRVSWLSGPVGKTGDSVGRVVTAGEQPIPYHSWPLRTGESVDQGA